MLNKKVCRACYVRDAHLRRKHVEAMLEHFDYNWDDMAKVLCPESVVQGWWVGVNPVPITAEPPEWCPYLTEHIVSKKS